MPGMSRFHQRATERLRGLPAIGRGVSGAIAGSNPSAALIAKERRRRG
jgi:hypothetical protein